MDRKLTPLQIIALKNGDDAVAENGSLIYKNSDVTLPPLPSYSYAYCSDTRYKPELAEQIHGVDILYHEATFTSEMKERAKTTYHSTAQEAAMLATQANAGKLLLGHFSTRYKDLTPILQEAQATFPDSELASEGSIFSLDG